jgi:ribosome-associated heat shock protein Hsp15
MSDESPDSIRIDRWLWAARFYKTRSLAKAAVEGGKVHLDGQRVKPAKDIRVGQSLAIRRGDNLQTVTVTGLSDRRGPAKIAATLYAETAESIETRELLTSKRRMEKAGLTVPSNRPSKRDRREIAKLKNTHDPMEDSFD